MDETIRWTVKVSKDTDTTLRMHLAQRGLKKGDLSKFIEEAVRWRVLHPFGTNPDIGVVGNLSPERLPHELEIKRGAIAQLCENFNVIDLAVFGSILRDDFDPARSDVDLVVIFGSPPGESAARQYFDFKAALEAMLVRRVDLVEWNSLPESRLKRLIGRTKRSLYAATA
jgi:predicted nucleotidyltransferase